MKKLTLKKGELSPTLDEINHFQESNNIKLPVDFIEFLITQNPIETLECFYIIEGREPFDISFFPFGNKNSEVWTFQMAFENLNEEFFEGKYVSFGSDSGGWQYVLSVQELDYGKVYFCRMDEELEDALTLLASSFEEFINGLQKPSKDV